MERGWRGQFIPVKHDEIDDSPDSLGIAISRRMLSKPEGILSKGEGAVMRCSSVRVRKGRVSEWTWQTCRTRKG